jgi:hypothetical protein
LTVEHASDTLAAKNDELLASRRGRWQLIGQDSSRGR